MSTQFSLEHIQQLISFPQIPSTKTLSAYKHCKLQAKQRSGEVPSEYDPTAHLARSDRALSAISDPSLPQEGAPVGGIGADAMDVWRDATDQLREREYEQSYMSGTTAVTTASGAQVWHNFLTLVLSDMKICAVVRQKWVFILSQRTDLAHKGKSVTRWLSFYEGDVVLVVTISNCINCSVFRM